MPPSSSHDGLHHRELRLQHEQLKRLRNAAGQALSAPTLPDAIDQLSNAIHREVGFPCAAGMLFDIEKQLYFNLGIPANQKDLIPPIRERAMAELATLLRCQVGARPCLESISSASVLESPLDLGRFLTLPLLHVNQPYGFLFTVGIPPQRTPHASLVLAAEFTAPIVMAIHASLRYRNTDPLTGLFNLRHLQETLQRTLMLGDRTRRPTSLILLDLNGFKRINDRHGHLAGDQVLLDFSRKLRNAVRFSDVPCRYGGDEFAVILPDTSRDDARHLENRLRTVLAQPVSTEQGTIQVGFACGVASVAEDEPGRSAMDLIQAADQAMYRDKA